MQTASYSLNCSYLINFFLPSESRVRSKPPSAEGLSRKVCLPPSLTLKSLFSSRSAEVRGNVVTSYRVGERFFRKHLLINNAGNAVIGGNAGNGSKACTNICIVFSCVRQPTQVVCLIDRRTNSVRWLAEIGKSCERAQIQFPAMTAFSALFLP